MFFLFALLDLLYNTDFSDDNNDKKIEINLNEIEITVEEVFVLFDARIISIFF